MDDLYKSNAFMSFFKLIYIFIIFLVVLGISYYFSRFIGKNVTGKNKLMKHIETISFGNDKNLHIVQICNEFYLISSSQKGVSLLDKLPGEVINNISYDINCKADDESFENYLDNAYDNINPDYNKYNIKQSIEKLKKVVKGNKTNE